MKKLFTILLTGILFSIIFNLSATVNPPTKGSIRVKISAESTIPKKEGSKEKKDEVKTAVIPIGEIDKPNFTVTVTLTDCTLKSLDFSTEKTDLVKIGDGNLETDNGNIKVYKYKVYAEREIADPVLITARASAIESGVEDGVDRIYVTTKAPCACSTCANGEGKASNDCIRYDINLGTFDFDTPVGELYYFFNGEPRSDLADPGRFYTQIHPASELIKDTDGRLKQLYNSKYLIDIEIENEYKFYVRFYKPEDVGPKSGDYYTVTGSAYRTITIENPDASPTVYNRLKFTQQLTVGTSTTTKVDEFSWNTDNAGWVLTQGTGSNARTETLSNEYDSDNNRIETRTVTNQAGTVIYKEVSKYKKFPWGDEIIETVVDPDGKALTTQYAYYDGDFFKLKENIMILGKLSKVIFPDGSWVKYLYEQAQGRIAKTVKPFINSDVNASESQCRVSEITYDDTNKITTYIEKVQGIEVSRRYEKEEGATISRSIVSVTPGAAIDNSANLVTVTEYYTAEENRGRVKSITRPDGTMTMYEYSTVGDKMTTMVYSGVPDENKTSIIDGTKTVTVTTRNGQTISSKSFDIASNIKTSSVTYSNFDEFGRPKRADYLDGTYKTMTYGCCGLASQTDRSGTVTKYAYDDLDRLSYTTRAGITTFYTYDANGNTVSTTRKGSDNSEITTFNTYNLAGEMVSSKDALNNITTYSEDGLVSTTTYPNETTSITTRNLDGSTASNSGTAVHGMTYEYGIENGELFTKSYPTGNSSQWVKTYTDFLGRNYKTLYGDNSYSLTEYDSVGRPVKQISPGGRVTLTSYNAKGEVVMTATDMNGNGSIDISGTDQITAYTRSVVNDTSHGDVYRQTTSVYNTEGSGTPLVVSVSDSSVTGLQSWNTSFGKTSHSRTTYNGSGQVTTVSKSPDNSTITNVTVNGLLQSSTNSVTGATTYTYDPHNRTKTVSKTVGGNAQTTTYSYNDNDQVVTITDTENRVTTYTYNNMGQRTKVDLPGNRSVNYEYAPTGELVLTYGSDAYPVKYVYDYAGRMKTLTTYKDYEAQEGDAVTTWNYDAQRGFMTSKIYSDNKGTAYTYNSDGQIATRKWARKVGENDLVTTYSYDNAGDLSSVDYSDTTVDITYTRDRLGRPVSITDAAGTKALSYNTDSSLASETLPHILNHSVAYVYDNLGRRTAMSINTGGASLATTAYTYDNGSRLATVSNGSITANYARISGSSMLDTTTINNGTADILTIDRNYDKLNRLTAITNTATEAKSFSYEYNDADKRTKYTLADGSYWVYQYDELGQLTSGIKYDSANNPITEQSFGFSFDDIGNRITSSVDNATSNYTSNLLNQYTEKTVPEGTVPENFTFDEDGNIISDGRFNYTWNAENRLIVLESISAADDIDHIKLEFTYDYMGRRAAKKAWEWVREEAPIVIPPEVQALIDAVEAQREKMLTQEAEQLDKMLSNIDAKIAKILEKKKGNWEKQIEVLEKQKDHEQDKTVAKNETINTNADAQIAQIYEDAGIDPDDTVEGDPVWTLVTDEKFAWDNWNLIAVFSGTEAGDPPVTTYGLTKSYLRGEDLIAETNHTTSKTYLALHDGNKNIVGYVDASDGTKVAEYEYSPFGKLIVKSGTMADDFAFKFSSYYTDNETGLVYYGTRYLDVDTGRWLNRDRIAEEGGLNIYCFVNNDGINKWDILGLKDIYFTVLYSSGMNIKADVKSLKKILKEYTKSRKTKDSVCIKGKLATKDNLRKALEEGYAFLYAHGMLHTKKGKGYFTLQNLLKNIPGKISVDKAIEVANPRYKRWLSKDSQAKYKAWEKRKRAYERGHTKIPPGPAPKTYTKEELAKESLTEKDFLVQISLLVGYQFPEKLLAQPPKNPISKEIRFYGCFAGLMEDAESHGIKITKGHDFKSTVYQWDIFGFNGGGMMEKDMKKILDGDLKQYKVK